MHLIQLSSLRERERDRERERAFSFLYNALSSKSSMCQQSIYYKFGVVGWECVAVWNGSLNFYLEIKAHHLNNCIGLKQLKAQLLTFVQNKILFINSFYFLPIALSNHHTNITYTSL